MLGMELAFNVGSILCIELGSVDILVLGITLASVDGSGLRILLGSEVR